MATGSTAKRTTRARTQKGPKATASSATRTEKVDVRTMPARPAARKGTPATVVPMRFGYAVLGAGDLAVTAAREASERFASIARDPQEVGGKLVLEALKVLDLLSTRGEKVAERLLSTPYAKVAVDRAASARTEAQSRTEDARSQVQAAADAAREQVKAARAQVQAAAESIRKVVDVATDTARSAATKVS